MIVSRDALIASHATVVCAPIYSRYDGLSTQVEVGPAEGLEHDSSVHCDALVSLPRASLTDYIGVLPADRVAALNLALRVALAAE